MRISNGWKLTLLTAALFILGQGAKQAPVAGPPAPKPDQDIVTGYNTYKKTNANFLQPEKKYTLKAGETFCIELETNPTTGYDWYFTLGSSEPRMIVKMTDDRYFTDRKKRLTGSPSKRIMKFVALSKGNAIINFKYCRSWEENVKAAAVRRYFVTVK